VLLPTFLRLPFLFFFPFLILFFILLFSFSSLSFLHFAFILYGSRILHIPILRRHLKLMYFTVLERFSREELLSQKAALSGLEADLLCDTKAKSRRRTLRNQKDRIHARLKELELEIPNGNGMSDVIEIEDDESCVLSCEPIDRKGLDVMCLPSPSSSSSSVHSAHNVHANTTSSTLHHEVVGDDFSRTADTHQHSLPEQHHSSPLDTSPTRQPSPTECEDLESMKEEENAVNARHERTLDSLIPQRDNLDPHFPNLVSVPSDSYIPLNPKTRLGWGFWQT
jgi:hypothetical protein